MKNQKTIVINISLFSKKYMWKRKGDWCDKKKLTPQARHRNNNYKVCG